MVSAGHCGFVLFIQNWPGKIICEIVLPARRNRLTVSARQELYRNLKFDLVRCSAPTAIADLNRTYRFSILERMSPTETCTEHATNL